MVLVHMIRESLGRRILPEASTKEELLAQLTPYEVFLLEGIIADRIDQRSIQSDQSEGGESLFQQNFNPLDYLIGQRQPVAQMHIRFIPVGMQGLGEPLELSALDDLDALLGDNPLEGLADILSHVRESDGEQRPAAIDWLYEDFNLIVANEMPAHTPNDYLKVMSLEGGEPDGETLLRRLLSDGNIFGQIRILPKVKKHIEELLYAASMRETTSAEEAMLHILATIANRQLIREGTSCPAVMRYGMLLAEARPDLIHQKALAVLKS